MKPFMRFAAAVLILVLTNGCKEYINFGEKVTGSGKTIQKSFDYKDFTAVEVSHVYNLSIQQGDDFQVDLTLDDNLEPYLDLQESLGKIRFSLKKGVRYNDLTLKLMITMPVLRELELSGAASCILRDLNHTGRLSIGCSGASKVGGSLTADRMELDVSGASNLELTGSARFLELSASGASDVDLKDCMIEEADVNVSGASSAKIHVSQTISGDASGASSLKYWGNPSRTDVTTSGASSAKDMGR